MKRTKLRRRPLISADGEGVANYAGSLLLHESADRVGLTGALSRVCAQAFRDVRLHDPGVVPRDLAVMIADGGDCLAHLCTLRDQPDLFGRVASDATARRVIDRLEQVCIGTLDAARAQARRPAWAAALQPERITLDIDSTLVTAHSEKEGAAATYKRGFGFHPAALHPRRDQGSARRHLASRQRASSSASAGAVYADTAPLDPRRGRKKWLRAVVGVGNSRLQA